MKKEELFEKYGNVKMKFTSYYKYAFMYKGTTEDGNAVIASVGGNSDDIYKLSVDVNEEINLSDLDVKWVDIKNDKDETLAVWTDPWW